MALSAQSQCDDVDADLEKAGLFILREYAPGLLELICAAPDPKQLSSLLEQIRQGLKSVSRDLYDLWKEEAVLGPNGGKNES